MHGESGLIEVNDDIRRLTDQRKQHFFSLRCIGNLHVGNEHVNIFCRHLTQYMQNPLETPAALEWLHLFVIIRVQQSEDDNEAAGCGL